MLPCHKLGHAQPDLNQLSPMECTTMQSAVIAYAHPRSKGGARRPNGQRAVAVFLETSQRYFMNIRLSHLEPDFMSEDAGAIVLAHPALRKAAR